MYIAQISIVVRDYDEAIDFYVNKLGWQLLEDTVLSEEKRWVRVAPKGARECNILLAKAKNQQELTSVGNQTGGRVGFFMHTDNFWEYYNQLVKAGVKFIRQPLEEEYGTVAVFEDLYGNLWDLIEPKNQV
ncbi:MAG: VOC family protein [Saprospiraceae bacterium]|nr:VOC family protein [Saprospiraceae bacterium]MBK6565415.1 VOC family protein [Saprospiraceae bacterium]MBK6784101.1 VOC family protein [Saprospiraceae bacterium]MBK8370863.1 VOC family protein [Saprospiraceae bacterium]MBK8546166.1 VOC family protein [Saprospiraceae bacterium]